MKRIKVPVLDDSEAEDVFCKTLETRLGFLSSEKKFYQGKKFTPEEFAKIAKRVFKDTLKIVGERASVRTKV